MRITKSMTMIRQRERERREPGKDSALGGSFTLNIVGDGEYVFNGGRYHHVSLAMGKSFGNCWTKVDCFGSDLELIGSSLEPRI